MKLKLNGVRLSFESIYEAVEKFGGPPKFSACFILDKEENKADLAEFKKIVNQLESEKFKGKELPIDKLPIQSGDDDEGNAKYDGWGGGKLIISAANKKRPVVVGRKRQPVADGDADAPYSGCYVNCILDLWPMQKHGERIVASLEAIQMAKDGEPFVASTVNVETDFDDVEEESSADIF